MKDFKGTPGNWYIDPKNPSKDEIHIESPFEATVIATLYCDPMDERTKADAKMCCASKDMAEALQELIVLCETMGLSSQQNEIVKAKAALSKALN